MLKLKSYSFKGIGRFVEKQTISLEDRDDLIQIDGENTNTGGSSGAGKSTTVEALAYLLGISDISATQLQSRITKSPIWVEGMFEGGITITRSKKDGLTIVTPEETVSGNSKLAEEKLDEIIGVSRKLLKTMCYKRQKQGGFFLNLTPKESHNFLVECLDLKSFQGKIFKLEDTLKNKYKPRKIELGSGIEVMEESIGQLESLLSEKKIPKKPETAMLADQKAEKAVLEQAYQNEEKNYKKALETLGDKPVKPSVPVFEKEIQLIDLKTKKKDLNAKILNDRMEQSKSCEKIVSTINTLQIKIKESENAYGGKKVSEETLVEYQQTMDHFSSGNCPTCKREWEAREEDLKVIKDKIVAVKEAIAAYEEEIAKIPQLQSMLEKAKQMLKDRQDNFDQQEDLEQEKILDEQIRVLQNEKDNLESVVNQEYLTVLNQYNNTKMFIDKEFNEKKNEYSDKMAPLSRAISTTELAIATYEDTLAAFIEDSNNISAKIKDSTANLNSYREELARLEKDILLSEESIRLIKNFTLQKFQDTLTYIGERATEIINNVPNMSNAVIYFDNAKETKSGNVKNEVNAVINLEGDVGVPIKTLSGGERTSADFAVDLAVAEMIESMTQKGVNFLILDEGFDGLDSISKIECLEILKGLNINKKILIVDHSSEVKEMVSDLIKVRRVNEESFVL